jgi:hypothetical protein
MAAAPSDPLEAGRALLAAHPHVKQILVDAKRARVAGQYFPLYRELGFTAEQIERFESIMISGMKDSTRLPGGEITVEAAPDLPKEEKERQLRELLGDSGYRRLQEYQISLTSYVSRLAGALYFTDTPLTAEQGRKLGDVFAGVHRKVSPGRTTPQEYWDAVATQAGAFLSEPQMASLGILRLRDEYTWAVDQARNSNAMAKVPTK